MRSKRPVNPKRALGKSPTNKLPAAAWHVSREQARRRLDISYGLFIGTDPIGLSVASKLDGDFAFALAGDNGEFYAARDPIGVASMYMGWGSDGSVWFASEMKTLQVSFLFSFFIHPKP